MYAHSHTQTFASPDLQQLSPAQEELQPWDVGQMRRLAERERSVHARALFGQIGHWLAELAHSRSRSH